MVQNPNLTYLMLRRSRQVDALQQPIDSPTPQTSRCRQVLCLWQGEAYDVTVLPDDVQPPLLRSTAWSRAIHPTV